MNEPESASQQPYLPQLDCPVCMPRDPQAACQPFTAVRQRIVDESHLGMTLLTCPRCGGTHVSIFTELIDWEGGDDSQASMRIPLPAAEADALRAAGEQAEAVLLAMHLSRRHLCDIHPRGSPPRTFWAEGDVMHLPHD